MCRAETCPRCQQSDSGAGGPTPMHDYRKKQGITVPRTGNWLCSPTVEYNTLSVHQRVGIFVLAIYHSH